MGFQATGSGGSSPVICGSNDGQHMIVNTDGTACVTAAFSFGSDTTTRNYKIHAIQYDSLNEMGGPAGCLQFFTGATGTLSARVGTAIESEKTKCLDVFTLGIAQSDCLFFHSSTYLKKKPSIC